MTTPKEAARRHPSFGDERTARPILAAVDDSDLARRAAQVAAELAQQLGSPLTLLHAAPAGPPLAELASERRMPPVHPERRQRLRRHAEKLLTEIARGTGGPTTHLSVEHGLAPEVIVARAAADDAQLIVMGTRRLGLAGRLVLGSVSSEVVKRAERPVLLVADVHRPGLRGDGPIVAAVDGSPLASLTAATARELAESLSRPLVLVHVLDSADAPSTRPTGHEAGVETVERHGNPADEILALAEDRGAALLVAGSRTRGALPAGLLGSVSGTLLDRAGVPVLLVTAGTRHPAQFT